MQQVQHLPMHLRSMHACVTNVAYKKLSHCVAERVVYVSVHAAHFLVLPLASSELVC